jgi:hypothetical protein
MRTLIGIWREEFPPQRLNESGAITVLVGIIGIFCTLDGMITAPAIGHVIKTWLSSK